MPQHSAGVLMVRRASGGPEVLLAHPGGPLWARRDDGVWSIPKGLYDPATEAPEDAARREFAEETGSGAADELTDLGEVRQPSGKRIRAFAGEGDLDPAGATSETFEMEWPPRSGTLRSFPEVDRVAWFDIATARIKLVPGQRPFLDRLEHATRAALRLRADLAHPWRVTREEAAAIQRRLAEHVRLAPLPASGPDSPAVAVGVDVAYAKDGSRAWAAAVAMDRAWRVLGRAVVEGVPDLEYAPGYLAFREGRLTIEALLALGLRPGVVFLDGHGVVHERGLGLASHVGVLLDVPTVGVPKTPFHAIDRSPGPRRGDFYVLTKEWGAQGASIRLKAGVKPVYVSPGHLVDLGSARELALVWSSGRHRVPEPLAAAHTASVHARNAAIGAGRPL